MIKNKIFAPKLYNEEYANDFIEVEDLGKNTIYDVLRKKGVNKLNFFREIINVLNRIQSIKDKKIKNFKNEYYTIPFIQKNYYLKKPLVY